MDPNGQRTNAASPGEWIAAGRAGIRRDPGTALLALAMAAVAFALVAVGLTLSQSGGLLRLAPYASLGLAPVVAALAVLRPWPGLLTWVVLTPALNLARASATIGPVQVILSTVVIAALTLGLWRSTRPVGPEAAPGSRTLRLATYLGAAALAALTVASVALGAAPLERSVPIALHGLIEPALLLAIAVALRPTWRAATALVVAMGASVALATVFNLVRIVVVRDLLTSVDEMRIQLARLTYYNVGIYGDMLAMAFPLLMGALLLRRAVRAPRWGVGLLAVGLLISLVGLYLTLTKSGWLGVIAASMALLLFLARTWRVRLGVIAAAAILAAAVVPYPAYLLRTVSPDLARSYEQIASVVNRRSSTIDPSTPGGEVSVTERLLATAAAIRMSVDHPLLGVGPGAFAAEYADHYRPASSTRAVDSALDLIPYVAAEVGLPAAALVGLALLGGILLAWLAGRRAHPEDAIARVVPFAVASALIGFVVVSATFGVDLYRDYRVINSDVLFAALLVALCLACWDRSAARERVAAPSPACRIG